ncbi:MAG: DUF4351 domain-containing protein [Magnetococcales bacterium]|nr:DUF4351 domain-containing protein [Magnetococcales bacterium]
MPYISSMERFGEERGRQKGEATMLTRLLQRRFGNLPVWVSEKITIADQPTLEEWSLRLFDAQSLDAVFADRT